MTAPIEKVFISHSSADEPFVDRFVADLATREIPAGLDGRLGALAPGSGDSLAVEDGQGQSGQVKRRLAAVSDNLFLRVADHGRSAEC